MTSLDPSFTFERTYTPTGAITRETRQWPSRAAFLFDLDHWNSQARYHAGEDGKPRWTYREVPSDPLPVEHKPAGYRPRFTVGLSGDMKTPWAVFDALAGPLDYEVTMCRKQRWAEEIAAGLEARHLARIAMEEDKGP